MKHCSFCGSKARTYTIEGRNVPTGIITVCHVCRKNFERENHVALFLVRDSIYKNS